MKIFLCVTLLLVGAAHSIDTDLSESEQVFESQFKKRYGDKESEQKAAAVLAASEKEINEQNKLFLAGKASFYEKLNKFSDVPKEIFEKQKEGDFNLKPRSFGDIDIDEAEWFTHPDLERLYQSRQTVPASFDATTKGWVTPVKNQLSCGSCAAFAITGAHETCMLMAGARFNGLDLSEQQLVDCGYNKGSMNGCDGADAPSYGVFFADQLKGQSAHEATYPYLDLEPKLSCPAGLKTYNSGAYVSKGLPDYYCTEDKLKVLVATYGAAVASIYASDKSLGNYGDAVFDKCTNTSTNHAILVVGYGTDPVSKKDFWLIRNSWGDDWGKGGFFKLQRGVGMCGIGKKCYAAQCAKTTGPLSDPPIIPPPPPIPASQECDVSSFFGALNGGVYTLTLGKYISKVNCVNGVCQPAVAGPSNACMYMCGKLQCKK